MFATRLMERLTSTRRATRVRERTTRRRFVMRHDIPGWPALGEPHGATRWDHAVRCLQSLSRLLKNYAGISIAGDALVSHMGAAARQSARHVLWQDGRYAQCTIHRHDDGNRRRGYQRPLRHLRTLPKCKPRRRISVPA